MFCDLSDYEIVRALLEEKHIKAWVNCTRRECESYQGLKSELEDENFEFALSGSNWGMGCNAIHLGKIPVRLLNLRIWRKNMGPIYL